MKLLIAIPALNEQDSIQSIIERTLAARERIIADSPITGVDIAVVSDGSTDKTVEIASQYSDRINLIVFEKNRGYGAAIKEAWGQSDADVLGFLDADGTCDPLFFTTLCNAMVAGNADVVLGSRLNPESKMPLVRRFGNSLFALLLSTLSSKRVRDTASGMRVVRRSCLPSLFPLPDGLHFTPAMSARAMLSDNLKIIETPMPYHEREGESKLRIIKDGLRFLKVILEATFLFRPSRPLDILGMVCLLSATVLMISPTLYYLEHRSVQEWMIYRFIVGNLLASSGLLLLSAAHISRRIVGITLSTQGRSGDMRDRFFSSSSFWILCCFLVILGIALVVPSFLELVETGATYEHWSRFIVSSFFISAALILIVTWIVDYSLRLMAAQMDYSKKHTRQ
ncbi:MAG: glycosyltransferase family 2 protein [Bacteroidota bacterium]